MHQCIFHYKILQFRIIQMLESPAIALPENAMKQIAPLTSLRAFLAIWVVTEHLFHIFEQGVFFDIGTRVALFERGYLGVDGFFILSGFILAYNYANDAFNYRKFITARFARIYPVHVVCLVAAVAMIAFRQHHHHQVMIGTPGNTYFDLVANLLLLNSWGLFVATGWNDVAWSVSSEWFAYVFFPIFVMLAPTRNRAAKLASLVIPVIALAIVEWRVPRGLSIPGGLMRLVPEFYAGVVLFQLRKRCISLPRFSGLIALSIVAVGVATHIDSLSVVGLGAFIFALSFDRDWLTRPLSAPTLVYLGEISYCMYMIQRFPMGVFSLARNALPSIHTLSLDAQIGLFAVLLLGCAATLHHMVENPCRKILRTVLSGKISMGSAQSQSPV